jgi:hypothetical protein
MTRLRKFIALPAAEQALFLRTGGLLLIIAFSLRILSFRTVRQLLEQYARPELVQQEIDPTILARITRALAIMSRMLLGPDSCLIQALAARTLLSQYVQPSRLRLGVAKTEDGKLVAHAWVESGNNIIVGGNGRTQYTPLPDLEEREASEHA